MRKREVITGRELKYAADNALPVFYEELYNNPEDKHMEFKEECVIEKGDNTYYIGNSNIDPGDWEPDERIVGDFPEGFFTVYKVKDVKYSEK